MKNLLLLTALTILSACATRGPSVPSPEAAEWSAYRNQVLDARDRGTLSTVEAQERIEQKYREIYGFDPSMEGAFAYGMKLYEAADAGDLSQQDADTLARARIDDALKHREFERPLYVFPPEASD
jgi:hypothetical protein